MPVADPTRENQLLRSVDWRFLVPIEGRPRALMPASGELAEALALVADQALGQGDADLVVIEGTDAEQLARAKEALSPDGHLVCAWPGGGRTRIGGLERKLAAAGFAAPALYAPGPAYAPTPEYWLPLRSPAAVAHLFSQRPATSRRERLDRALGRLFARLGYAAVTIAVAPLADATPATADADLLRSTVPWALLTHGSSVDSKAVGLPFPPGLREPEVAAKIGRLPDADESIAREEEALTRLAAERPDLPGVPRVRASGRRAGRRVLIQDAMDGRPLAHDLDATTLQPIAGEMTDWLVRLAGNPAPQPPATWRERLIDAPLDELERDHAAVLPTDFIARARHALAGIGELPLVWEHRDLGHWNVVVPPAGGLAIFDWEHSEPRGLPALDLTWFLLSTGFTIAGAWDEAAVLRVHGQMLDPATELGAVSVAAFADYAARTGTDPDQLPRLRLLSWIVQGLLFLRRSPGGGGLFVPLATRELELIESTR